MDSLPDDLLHEIASNSPAAYRGLVLAYPRFARMINVWKRIDYMILAGVDCRISQPQPRFLGSCINWTMNGKSHSVFGPSRVGEHGFEIWHKNGEYHRLDGPAMTHCGWKKWYVHGVLHRADGPAVDGVACDIWLVNGKRHREDGPAYADIYGTSKWYRDDVLHRTDGPAVVRKNWIELWYSGGELHRIDGPAVILPGGIRQWWQEGKLHRIGGPAIENPGARRKKRWYIYGKRYMRTDYERKYGCS